jgi:hypothetical protein
MQSREAYKKKRYTELELVQARFARFKAQGQNFDADTRERHNQHVEKVTQHVNAAKTKLKELDAAQDDVWEELVGGVEDTWGILQSTLEDAVTTFKD